MEAPAVQSEQLRRFTNALREVCHDPQQAWQSCRCAGLYVYTRHGLDERLMELRLDGSIGLGAAGCETRWQLQETDGQLAIALYGDKLTCVLEQQADGWRGRWLEYERCETSLVRYHGYDLGIPTLNQYAALDRTIDAALAGSLKPERILIIDNGGGYQPKREGVEVIRPHRNLGVAASWNVLLRLSEPKPLIIANDDLQPGQDTLEKLLRAEAPCAHIGFLSCFKLAHWVPALIGYFDETFYPAYYEDNDYARRMRLLGLELVGIDTHCQHGGSSTLHSLTGSQKSRVEAQIEASRLYYLRKWGGPPDHEVFTTAFNRD